MVSTDASPKRGSWSSSLGFILAAAGSAVGLGNIWRFPYLTGENGGAAFVLIYVACVVLIGIPLLYNEMALGRFTRKGPVGAFQALKPNTWWVLVPWLSVISCFVVLSYYSVIAGWTVGYVGKLLIGDATPFGDFVANPLIVLGTMGIFILLTIYIVAGGVEKGIEKWSKILMPVLFLLLMVITIRSITLPGAEKGIEFYLVPDFSKITWNTWLVALGQAFFSMSVGWGIMIAYASYMPKESNMIQSGLWVAIADTAVALLGGLMIFPAVFAFGKEPAAGATLVFKVLPDIFSRMPLGNVLGALFFVLLVVAALTSSISMLEVSAGYFVDEKGWNRKTAVWLVGIAAFVVGIPSALSFGANEWLSHLQLLGKTGFLEIVDHLFGNFIIILFALLTTIFVGWVWGHRSAIAELATGASGFARPLIGSVSLADIWAFFIRYIAPVVIFLMIYFQVSE